jgi:16S rRNA (adenine1518-N6/adenine1519-N6)-dimethyltransferase
MRHSGHRFKARRWGQNFLVNQGAADSIIAAFRPAAGDRVLEVGPGEGALTARLVGRVGRIAAVEVDPDLAEDLRRRLAGRAGTTGLEIIHDDILKADLRAILSSLGASPAAPARVIANLPYNIATAVILRFLLERAPVRDLLVMVQREVAERILSPPGRKSYGGLSVLCQVHARIEAVLRLRPGSFRPRPKVDSDVIRLTVREPGPAVTRDPAALPAILAAAFAHRRKTLQNNLALLPGDLPGRKGALGAAGATDLILRAGLDPSARAESVPPEGFLRLLEVWRPQPA